MAYNYEYPGVNMNDYNNDWLINKVKGLALEWKQVQSDWEDEQEAFQSLKSWIENYFKNLDITQEIRDKIDDMAEDGTLLSIMKDDIISTTDTWLRQNITAGQYPIDRSLSLNNAVPESSVVGNKLRAVEGNIYVLDTQETTINGFYLSVTGTEMENDNFSVTDYIKLPLTRYSKLSIATDSDMSSGAHFCIYDINRQFINKYYVELNTHNIVDIPLNAYYIRACVRIGKSIAIDGVDIERINNNMIPYGNVEAEETNGLYRLTGFFSENFNMYYKWIDSTRPIREIRGKMLLSESNFNSFRIGFTYSDGFQGYIIMTTKAVEIYTKELSSIANAKINITFGLHDYRIVLSERCFSIYIDNILTAFLYSSLIGREMIRVGFQYRGNEESNTCGTMIDTQPARSYIHFSFDDAINVFEDLTKNADRYTSIFDNTFFKKLKNLHDQYGATFSLYCFQESPTFNLDNTTTKFKNEFHANSRWLKIGYHAYNADTYEGETSVETLLDRVAHMRETIIKFSSVSNYDAINRFGFFSVTKEQMIALRKNNLLFGTLTADDSRDANVGLSGIELTAVRTAFEYHDYQNDIIYIKTLPRYDSNASTTPALSNVINSYDNLSIECFAHSLGDAVYQRVTDLYEMVKSNGIASGYYNTAH